MEALFSIMMEFTGGYIFYGQREFLQELILYYLSEAVLYLCTFVLSGCDALWVIMVIFFLFLLLLFWANKSINDYFVKIKQNTK